MNKASEAIKRRRATTPPLWRPHCGVAAGTQPASRLAPASIAQPRCLPPPRGDRPPHSPPLRSPVARRLHRAGLGQLIPLPVEVLHPVAAAIAVWVGRARADA